MYPYLPVNGKMSSLRLFTDPNTRMYLLFQPNSRWAKRICILTYLNEIKLEICQKMIHTCYFRGMTFVYLNLLQRMLSFKIPIQNARTENVSTSVSSSPGSLWRSCFCLKNFLRTFNLEMFDAWMLPYKNLSPFKFINCSNAFLKVWIV